MKNVVVKSSLFIVFVLIQFIGLGQKKSEQLKTEQEKLEKQVSTTKSMLDKVKKNTQASMSELKLIDNQVRARQELVQNVDNQIRGAELTISSKSNQIKSLTERVKRLKAHYQKLVVYAYKHRNRYSKMMYIFSASNYFEAVKRNAYLKRIAELQHKQFKLIQQNQKAIKREIGSIYQEKKGKEELLSLKIKEKEEIEKDKREKEKALNKLKKDEGKLLAELKTAEKKKAELKKRIKKAIESEIAAAEAKEKKKSSSGSSSSTKTKTSSGSTSTETKVAEKKPVVVTETKESSALGKNFEANRGKLPWPVLKGTITEAYGKNPHPTLANVYTNNNGIDIGAPKSSQVRAVFEGEVTSVFNIAGAGKVVIVKHGAYRTVYSNLQEVFVSVGSKVTTKQAIGSLLPDEGGLSTCHFEIHQVVDGMVQRINPSLWLAQ